MGDEAGHDLGRTESLDPVLVGRPGPRAFDEAFPDAGAAARGQWMALGVPAIEVADDRDAFGVGRPDGEARPLTALVLARVGTESFPDAPMAALPEQIQVVVR